MKIGNLVEVISSFDIPYAGEVGVVVSIEEPTFTNPVELALIRFLDNTEMWHMKRHLSIMS